MAREGVAPMMPRLCDFIIVGGESAGRVVAARLGEDPGGDPPRVPA